MQPDGAGIEKGKGQIRDSVAGSALRDARKSRQQSIREAASRLGVSKSALSRYESGEVAIPEDVLAAACRQYPNSTAVLEAFNSHSGDRIAGDGFYYYPKDFDGDVHLVFRPEADSTATPRESMHHVRLDWGPWSYSAHLMLPPTGLCLVTGKFEEDAPVPLLYTVAPPARISFGLGRPESEQISIHQDWQLSQGSWVGHHVVRLLKSLLENAGRTEADLADFLKVEPDALAARFAAISKARRSA